MDARRNLVRLGLALVLGLGGLGGLPDASPSAQATPVGCAMFTETDYNGDGFTDAVVADPLATVAGKQFAGQVVVLYGDDDRRVGEGVERSVVRQGKPIAGTPETGDQFGAALASADLDCDGYTDLVVGSPREDVLGVDSGFVQIVYGAALGLGYGKASIQLTQADFGLPSAAGDLFGYAVDALEDVEQGDAEAPDAYAIGIGAPGVDLNGAVDAGWAGFLVPGPTGAPETVEARQGAFGVPGVPEAGDRFGSSLTLGYFIEPASSPDPAVVDAAVGAPGEDIGSVTDAGDVTIVSLSLGGGIRLDQNSPGVPGGVEAGDRFGSTLDSIRGTLAVGVPYEDIGAAADAGLVQLFSTFQGATLVPDEAVSQDTAGVSGVAEADDLFGSAVTLAQGNGQLATERLAVGAPGEDAEAVDSGAVSYFQLSAPSNDILFTQSSAGVIGVPAAGERFGAHLAIITGDLEAVLLVGVPDDTSFTAGLVDVIQVGFGSGSRFWAPGFDLIPSGGVAFGRTLSSRPTS